MHPASNGRIGSRPESGAVPSTRLRAPTFKMWGFVLDNRFEVVGWSLWLRLVACGSAGIIPLQHSYRSRPVGGGRVVGCKGSGV